MQQKTIVIISLLVLLTVGLFFAAWFPQHTETTGQKDQYTKQRTDIAAQTILAISPTQLALSGSRVGTADITIDTKSNTVTAVQIELQYDPQILKDVTITAGDFIPQPIVLIHKPDAKAGRITFAVGINPSEQPAIGQGVIAHISFTKVPSAKTGTSPLTLLKTSLVTSSGIDGSVLKDTRDATVTLSR